MASSDNTKNNTMPKVLLKIFIYSCLCLSTLYPSDSIAIYSKELDSSIVLNSNLFGVPQGLSQGTVTSIVQDNDGYLWIGTFNGLNRFDGSNFKYFFADGTNSGLPSSFIRSLQIDKNGILYVGTDNGLAVYDKNNDSFIKYGAPLDNTPIWSINTTIETLIVGTNNAIIDIHGKENHLDLSSKGIGEIKKSIKIGDDYFLKDYSGKLFKINQESSILIKENIIDIEQKNNKSLIISTKDGLFEYDGVLINRIDNRSFSQLAKNNNTIYGISENYIIDINNKKTIGLISAFNPDKTTVFYANNNFFTLGSVDQGFFIIKKQNNLVKKTSLTTNSTWHLSKNSQGFLVSSEAEKITLFNNEFKKIRDYNTYTTGYKYALLHKNQLLYGTSNGLFLDNSNSVKKLSNETISALSSNEDDSILSAGTPDGKILIIKNSEIIKTFNTERKEPIFDIETISENLFYIASQGGLRKYDNGQETLISEQLTYSIQKDRNYLLFGTSKALMRYDITNEKIDTLFSKNKEIYSIASDTNFITVSSLGEVIIFDKNSKTSYALGTSNGSQYEYNSPSAIKINDFILLAGINGVSLVSPQEISDYIKSQKANKTEISKFSVFNMSQEKNGKYLKKPIDVTKEITLKYSDYPFSFDFISPMSDESSTNYYYRMLGLSDTWIYSNGTNSATYTNLSPGEYVFQVYTINNLSGEKSSEREVNVIITPPWWSSTQAKIFYFLITMFLSLFIFKAILRKREIQRQIALSEERLKLSLWGSGDEMWDWDIETGNIFRSNIWGALEFPRDGHRSGNRDEEDRKSVV